MATKPNTLSEPRAVVEAGGYYYILPVEEAMQLFKLLDAADRAEKDWSADGYKKCTRTSEVAALRGLTISQYASYKLTLDN